MKDFSKYCWKHLSVIQTKSIFVIDNSLAEFAREQIFFKVNILLKEHLFSSLTNS